MVLNGGAFCSIQSVHFVEFGRCSRVLRKAMTYASVRATSVLPSNLFRVLRDLLGKISVEGYVRGYLSNSRHRVASTLTTYSGLARMFVLTYRVPMVRVGDACVSTTFLGKLYRGHRVLSKAKYHGDTTISLLMRGRLIFTILFCMVRDFVYFKVTILGKVVNTTRARTYKRYNGPRFQVVNDSIIGFLRRVIRLRERKVEVYIQGRRRRFVSTGSTKGSLVYPFLRRLSGPFRYAITNFITVSIISLFRIIRVGRCRASVVYLRGFHNGAFTRIARKGANGRVVTFYIFLAFCNNRCIQSRFTSNGLRVQGIVNIQFFLKEVPLERPFFVRRFRGGIYSLQIRLYAAIFTRFFMGGLQ